MFPLRIASSAGLWWKIERERTYGANKLGRIVRWFAWAALAGVLPTCADWQEALRSPDGSVEVSVCAKGRRLSWRVARKGATLFDDSEIGLEFKGQKPFGAFTVANRSERAFDTSWETRLYKKRVVRDHGRELKLELAEMEAPGRRFDVYVRAYDGAAALLLQRRVLRDQRLFFLFQRLQLPVQILFLLLDAALLTRQFVLAFFRILVETLPHLVDFFLRFEHSLFLSGRGETPRKPLTAAC